MKNEQSVIRAEELDTLQEQIGYLAAELDKQGQTINQVCQVINNLTQLLSSIEQNSRINSQNINVLKNRLENLPYEINDPTCGENTLFRRSFPWKRQSALSCMSGSPLPGLATGNSG